MRERWEKGKREYDREYRRRLGGRIRTVATGGAMSRGEVMEWMRSFFPNVTESYGSTECSGCMASGVISSSVDVILKDWENFTANDKPYPRGEICVKSSRLFAGYWNQPDLTSSSFDSLGYYSTGGPLFLFFPSIIITVIIII